VLGAPAGAPFWDVVHAAFPEAIGHALAELCRAIETPGSVRWQSDAYLADLGKAWLAILRQAGPPHERAMPVPPPPYPDPVKFARTLTDAD
jgi:NAD-dependent oxidoreductase involved in siderophore biosynthesis